MTNTFTDEELASYFAAWSDLELRDHFEVSNRGAQAQFRHGERQTAQAAHACRLSAHRYQRELLRRAREDRYQRDLLRRVWEAAAK